MELSKTIVELMKIKEISPSELAKRSTINLAFLYRVITGEVNDIKLSMAQKIAKGLGISITELIREEATNV